MDLSSKSMLEFLVFENLSKRFLLRDLTLDKWGGGGEVLEI